MGLQRHLSKMEPEDVREIRAGRAVRHTLHALG